MDLLFIGYSSLVQRRVLPAITSLPEIAKIHIATRKEVKRDSIATGKLGRICHDYAKALEECGPCIAYISLPNNLHAEWALRALSAGFHVIVDKPSVLNIKEALTLSEIAERKGLCLAEANAWHYHPLTTEFTRVIANEGSVPQSTLLVFSSPPMNEDNFRYDPKKGGGVVYDRGPYAVSCGRIIYGEKPEEVTCTISSRYAPTGVDESCSITMRYKQGVLHCFFSIGAEYCNRISAFGKAYSFDVERVFTPPPDYFGTVHVKRKNNMEKLSVGQADTFGLFLKDIINSIDSRSFGKFRNSLVQDAEVMEMLLNINNIKVKA